MHEFLAVQASELAPQRLRRKALELLDDATSRLDRYQGGDPAVVVHEIRRRFKELRAVVSMVGDSLPHGGRGERTFFRDAGRLFAPQRDAKAAVEAFDKLREHFAHEWTPRQFLKIRRALASQVVPPIDPVVLAGLRSDLAAERSTIAAWAVDGLTAQDLWAAISRTYRASRRAMRTAMRQGTRDLFHEWRRQAKVLWYQEQFFELLGMAKLDSQIRALHKLSRVLGDHHDLVVIDDLCRRTPQMFGSPRYVRRFRGFLSRRMRSLEENAEEIGDSVFQKRTREWAAAEAPRNTVRRRIGPKRSSASTTEKLLAVSS